MLVGGILLGLVAGLAAGGRLDNLLHVRLRWVALLFLAVLVRFGTELVLARGWAPIEQLRQPLFSLAYGLLLVGLWVNRHHPGFALAFVGSLANAVAILLNGGAMPIYEPSLRAAGLGPEDVTSPFYSIVPAELPTDFILRAGPLIDLIPLPIPPFQGVASVGDLFLGAGLMFFAFAAVLRGGVQGSAPTTERLEAGPGTAGLVGLAAVARPPSSAEATPTGPWTGLGAGLAEASALERPLVLAGSATGLAAPALVTLPAGEAEGSSAASGPLPLPLPTPRPRLPVWERFAVGLRTHPYVRLALNGGFSALWAGQLISLFGDRIHQVALVFLVLGVTNSPAAVGLVFVAATLPNLVLGPVAGTFVDRWEHREVMIVADLLRAAVIVLVPLAAVTNVLLVFPLVFLVTAISVFFRPARTAIIPRIVERDELMAANSATWVGETIADIVGYPLAGIFVALLGAALPLAFWVDAGTYLVSAALLTVIRVTPIERTTPSEGEASPGFLAELKAGWHFLRRETVLLANTLQGVVGQLTSGMLLTVAPLYARDAIVGASFEPTAIYGFLETGIGVGNLAGGFLLGLVGARLAKGKLVIVGYAAAGLCTAALAFTGVLPVALGLMVGIGVANMVYVIPSQTLFQERTPTELMGRVVGFRFALVFGAMTLAMGAAGLLVELVGLGPVLVVSGFMTFLAGVAGLLVPAVRRA